MKAELSNPLARRFRDLEAEMWETTEYTEHTEKRLFTSVYSVYSVVSQSNGIAAEMASISRGRSEKKSWRTTPTSNSKARNPERSGAGEEGNRIGRISRRMRDLILLRYKRHFII
jgi:hypothetical protein